MTRDKAVEKLLKELPELLADYEHCALDANGKLDPCRRARIRRINNLLFVATLSQFVKC